MIIKNKNGDADWDKTFGMMVGKLVHQEMVEKKQADNNDLLKKVEDKSLKNVDESKTKIKKIKI